VYVFIHRDLSFPQQVVQACHACYEMASTTPACHEHPSVILLGIDNETKLLACLQKLQAAGIEHREFREPDIGHQLTSIATTPIIGDRSFFRKYQLLRNPCKTPT
jgi:hypothetical protein